jgi:hypothetical protein
LVLENGRSDSDRENRRPQSQDFVLPIRLDGEHLVTSGLGLTRGVRAATMTLWSSVMRSAPYWNDASSNHTITGTSPYIGRVCWYSHGTDGTRFEKEIELAWNSTRRDQTMQTAEITYLIVTLLLALALMIKWKRQGAIAARLNRGLLGYVVARSTVQLSEPEDTRGEDLIPA